MSKLFEKRQSIRQAEAKLGLSELSEHERAIYAFVDSEGMTYRDAIIRHDYFKGISLSTMKRAVKILLESNLITAIPSSEDKRIRLLHIT